MEQNFHGSKNKMERKTTKDDFQDHKNQHYMHLKNQTNPILSDLENK